MQDRLRKCYPAHKYDRDGALIPEMVELLESQEKGGCEGRETTPAETEGVAGTVSGLEKRMSGTMRAEKKTKDFTYHRDRNGHETIDDARCKNVY